VTLDVTESELLLVNRTERLYAIAEALRAAGDDGRTSAWLATRFEVSTRTIKRDVTALQEAGRPIAGSGGRGGGYRIDPAVTLPPIAFTPAEAIAIATLMSVQGEVPFATEGRRALAKVLDAMVPGGRSGATSLAGRVWTRPSGDGRASSSSSRALRVVEEAVARQVVVVIDYVDGHDAETRRRPVEPLGFANTRGSWYLMAWCRWRRAGRWFRIDRIRRADLTTQPAPPRDLADVFGPIPEGAHPVEV
jgi:predicted DNA-binding transcriptional regulator YafY